MAAERKEDWYAEKVAKSFIERIQAGRAGTWEKEWVPGSRSQRPWNGLTGKDYGGSNWLLFYCVAADRGWSDPRWLTEKQAHKLGATVRESERGKGTYGVFWKMPEDRGPKSGAAAAPEPVIEDAEGTEDDGADEEGGSSKGKRGRPKRFSFCVYNAAQLDGLAPLPEIRAVPEWERNQRVERLAVATKADIRHQDSNHAFYMNDGDYILMPERGQFKTVDGHARTLLHELAHWTKHEKRLDRKMGARFGLDSQAREELRAEIAATLLGEELQVGSGLENHASYVASWARALKSDPKEILEAARDASTITKYLLDMDLDLQKERAAEREAYLAGVNAYLEQNAEKGTDLDKEERNRRGDEARARAEQHRDAIWADSADDGRTWPLAWRELPAPGEQPAPSIPAVTTSRVVVVSSALEALTFHRLHGRPADTAYVLDGPEVVRDVLRLVDGSVNPKPHVVIGTENTPRGTDRAAHIAEQLPSRVVSEMAWPPRLGGWTNQLVRGDRKRNRERGQGASLGR